MPFDYLTAFPLPRSELPQRLLELLAPAGLAKDARVEVAARQDLGRTGPRSEFLQMVMAVIPGDADDPIACLREATDGLVQYSTPCVDSKSGLANFDPSISGYDYIVAAWGGNSFYTYHLSEKVWMALGLTARCVGGDKQRLVYDDLSLPEYAVAEGDVSSQFEWRLKKDIVWTMSNHRLREYLWMRGATGARVFFYEILLDDSPGLREVMNGQKHVRIDPPGNWCEIDLREHQDGLFLQVWATVVAVSSERCVEDSADGLSWPQIGLMTSTVANALVVPGLIYLDDRFLERYEQDGAYDTTPRRIHDRDWHCSPSYLQQWSFTDCVRVGRNLIRVSVRELYKGKPDKEIVHAYQFALAPEIVARLDLTTEHIVSKTQRLLDAYLNLGDALASLGQLVGLNTSAFRLIKISRIELEDNGWTAYPQLSRLAQVAPLSMSQQGFLSRCKSLHEFSQGIPSGFLKDLLTKAGIPRLKVKGLGSLKLLQGLLNIVQGLNADQEKADAFASSTQPEDWQRQNNGLVGLFVAHDLRTADAHEVRGSFERLESLDFDLAEVNAGYGTALDRVFDRVIEALSLVGSEIDALLRR